MKLVLATGSDKKYYHKILPYLDSVQKNSNFDENYLIYMDDEPIKSAFKKIKVSHMLKEYCRAPSPINCLQHGDFLNTKEMLALDDSDVICFTDGDIILQRRMTTGELEMLRMLGDGDVFVGYNVSPDDNLYDEAQRLTYTGAVVPGLTDIDLRKIKVYNTGVLAMNKKTWWRQYNDYVSLWDKVDSMFTHYAKQQWLISYIVNTMGYNVYEMPYQFHSHGHAGIPLGCYFKDGHAMNNGKKILFRHKL